MLTKDITAQGPPIMGSLENWSFSWEMFDDCQNGAVVSELSQFIESQPQNQTAQENMEANDITPNFWPMQLSMSAADIILSYFFLRLMRFIAHHLSVMIKGLIHACLLKRNQMRGSERIELAILRMKPNDQDDIKCLLYEVNLHNNSRVWLGQHNATKSVLRYNVN